MSSTTILAIDTATEACSVALHIDDHIHSHFEVCPQQHSQRILPLVDELLSQANITLKSIDGLAFGRGPGSFTGVRIGIGIAQGLAFGVGVPVIPISNLHIIAQGAVRRLPTAGRIAVAIDARMNEVYFAQYEVKDGMAIALTEESVMSPNTLVESLEASDVPMLAVGTGWQAYQTVFSTLIDSGKLLDTAFDDDDAHLPNAVDMLAIAQKMFVCGETVKATEAEPVYVRNTVTWKKLPGRE